MKQHGKFRLKPQWFGAGVLTVLLLAGMGASAQDMPPPHKSPRVPVHRQVVVDTNKKDQLKSRDVSGTVTIIDNEHLRVSDVDVRLFGIVPPQLSASFGPQTRAALDELTRNQNTSCHVRDRDHDGRFLATCTVNAATRLDLALELLKRGLAVTARGSLEPTELAAPYLAAEQAAQAQKLGLWSVAPPPPATVSAVPAPTSAKTDNANVPPLPSDLKKDEKPAATDKVAAVMPIVPLTAPKTSAAPAVVATAATVDVAPKTATANDGGSDVAGFFARYQLLITGLVMLATAFGIMGVLAAERRRDRRDEMKAIAAALRGELLAARAVCISRLKSWTDSDESTPAWPRIRATLYQAYVIKIGWLGAVLARQVASIYGQASDYAAYFAPNSFQDPRADGVSKRKALTTLVQHIEEVLPKLAYIEQSGQRPRQVTPPPVPLINYMPSTVEQQPAPEAQPVQEEPQSYTPPPAESPASPAQPLWNIVKRFSPGRRDSGHTGEEALTDYTALIEEEMARMSAEEESASSGATKMRGTGA